MGPRGPRGRRTVHVASTVRVEKTEPRTDNGASHFQPSGSASGPGMGVFSRYAICRGIEASRGRMMGQYPSTVPSLVSNEHGGAWKAARTGHIRAVHPESLSVDGDDELVLNVDTRHALGERRGERERLGWPVWKLDLTLVWQRQRERPGVAARTLAAWLRRRRVRGTPQSLRHLDKVEDLCAR